MPGSSWLRSCSAKLPGSWSLSSLRHSILLSFHRVTAGEREGFLQESSLEAPSHQMKWQEEKGKLSAFSLVRALLPCEGNRLEPKHLAEISS